MHFLIIGRINMLKNSILVIALLIFTACASEKPRITAIDGSAIPPAFAQFPDIPFPQESYVDLDETKALGSGENWIGSLAFDTPYNASSVFDFYMSEMPKLNWVEVATVRAKFSQMTYGRNKRVVQILIESTGSDSSKVTITAIPNQNTYR